MTIASTETVVDRLYAEFRALDDLLQQRSEPSLAVTANDCFRKVLLLSAASHFEAVVTDVIKTFVSATTSGNELVIEFVKRKALSRQYHMLFDWEAHNANRFFSLFGESFKRAMEARVKTDVPFADAIGAFLEIGRDRNRMVHEDFGQFVLEKTADEIYALFKRAAFFVDELPSCLAAGRSPTESTAG